VSGFLLDRNVVSESSKPRPDARVDAWFNATEPASIYLSVLTAGEIRRGIAGLPMSARRVGLEVWFKNFLSRFEARILPVTQDIAERWGVINAKAESIGRPLPIFDSLLASTAIEHNLTLVTRDSGQLSITGVVMFNPWQF
jgi:predicted nucleic acid-binding protein